MIDLLLVTMPDRCVAGGCSNEPDIKAGISLHKWPRDEKIAGQWTKFVQLDRKWEGPTKSSALCTAHFRYTICIVLNKMP